MRRWSHDPVVLAACAAVVAGTWLCAGRHDAGIALLIVGVLLALIALLERL